ncbi:MAG TPA: hypothetical protein EYN07_07755 [Flavobacteriaceae bacterium]|nr:hypothetical protein [Flavobacteriaceae bacterium]HIN99120.1 hypothetical protein [Flavobacteriaceae bacterium]
MSLEKLNTIPKRRFFHSERIVVVPAYTNNQIERGAERPIAIAVAARRFFHSERIVVVPAYTNNQIERGGALRHPP